MPEIFAYTDYRAYLRDYIEEKRKTKPFFSFRYVGLKLSIDPSQFFKIVNGQLHLSKTKIEEVVDYLKLGKKEAEYFRLLVGYAKAKTPEDTRIYFDKLVALSGVQNTELEKDQYLFFMKWYYTAIWCALNIFDCNENYEELGQLLIPPIEKKEAIEAVELLRRLNLVEKSPAGYWKSTDENLSTGTTWRGHAVRQYQLEMMRMAAFSLERTPKEKRDISTVTLNINDQILEEMKLLTEEYRRTMIKLSNETEGTDQVVQLNIQLFPLTNKSVSS